MPRQLARQIHDSPTRAVIAVTGGGSRVISELLTTPGASRTVLEATVPYSAQALDEWIGATPESYCSAATARDIAMAAYCRAQHLAGDDVAEPLCGIGATASLASDRPKRGSHRIHAAFQTSELTAQFSLTLAKDTRTREQEEEIVALLLMNVVAWACDIEDRVELPLTNDESIELLEVGAPPDWQELLAGECDVVLYGDDESSSPQLVFPGAFNPRHDGHRQMASIASEMFDTPVTHELSIENVDKPPIDFIELDERVSHFDVDAGEQIALTRAATFVEKTTLFPGATFIVGADTICRIAEPRYYEDSENGPGSAEEAIDMIADAGCRFLVFGRVRDGEFISLDDMSLPPALLEICSEVPEEKFRSDVSSTAIREQAAAGDD